MKIIEYICLWGMILCGISYIVLIIALAIVAIRSGPNKKNTLEMVKIPFFFRGRLFRKLNAGIDTCKGNTSYTSIQLEAMKRHGRLILIDLLKLPGKQVTLDERVVTIKIKGLRFGHNNIYIDISEYESYKAIKQELDIHKPGGNGYCTSVVIQYNWGWST